MRWLGGGGEGSDDEAIPNTYESFSLVTCLKDQEWL